MRPPEQWRVYSFSALPSCCLSLIISALAPQPIREEGFPLGRPADTYTYLPRNSEFYFRQTSLVAWGGVASRVSRVESLVLRGWGPPFIEDAFYQAVRECDVASHVLVPVLARSTVPYSSPISHKAYFNNKPASIQNASDHLASKLLEIGLDPVIVVHHMGN